MKTILTTFRKKQRVVELNVLQCITCATSSPEQFEIALAPHDFA